MAFVLSALAAVRCPSGHAPARTAGAPPAPRCRPLRPPTQRGPAGRKAGREGARCGTRRVHPPLRLLATPSRSLQRAAGGQGAPASCCLAAASVAHLGKLLTQRDHAFLQLAHARPQAVALRAQHAQHARLPLLGATLGTIAAAARRVRVAARGLPAGGCGRLLCPLCCALCCDEVLFHAFHQIPLPGQLSLQLRRARGSRLGVACGGVVGGRVGCGWVAQGHRQLEAGSNVGCPRPRGLLLLEGAASGTRAGEAPRRSRGREGEAERARQREAELEREACRYIDSSADRSAHLAPRPPPRAPW